jgi:hypothetical protein
MKSIFEFALKCFFVFAMVAAGMVLCAAAAPLPQINEPAVMDVCHKGRDTDQAFGAEMTAAFEDGVQVCHKGRDTDQSFCIPA